MLHRPNTNLIFKALIDRDNPLRIPRLNSHLLYDNPKIQITIEILRAYRIQFVEKNKIHGDLNGSSIWIAEDSDQYQVLIKNSKDLEFNTTNQKKDIEQLISTLQTSLKIDNPLALAGFEVFLKQSFTKNSLNELINDLSAFQIYPRIGVTAFYEILEANPGRDVYCFLCKNWGDGVGDFTHFWEFAKRYYQRLKKQKYTIVGIIMIPQGRPETSREAISKYIEERLKSKESPFDQYLLYKDKDVLSKEEDEAQFVQFSEENKDKIEYINNNFAGALLVSSGSEYLLKIVPNYTTCLEYGSKHQGNVMQHPRYCDMGLSSEEQSIMHPQIHPIGIKVDIYPVDDFKGRVLRLFSIRERENKFINILLETKGNEVNLQQKVEFYLKHVHFMPSYLQTINDACAMILSHVMQYQGDGKRCDFFMPKNVVDKGLIIQLLKKLKLSDTEIEFYVQNNMGEYVAVNVDGKPVKEKENAKVRILSGHIHNDEDYKNLFRISHDGAGCSGDSSMSIVFSGPHLPFYEDKGVVIAPLHRFLDQVQSFVHECIQDAIDLNDALLKEGLEALFRYINYITNFKKTLNLPGYMVDTDAPPEYKCTYNEEKYILLSEPFFEGCQTIAELRKSPYIQMAWLYVSDKIKRKQNVFDRMESIIVSSLYNTDGAYKFTADFQALVKLELITENTNETIPDYIWTMMIYNFNMVTILKNDLLQLDKFRSFLKQEGGYVENEKISQYFIDEIMTNLRIKIITAIKTNQPNVLTKIFVEDRNTYIKMIGSENMSLLLGESKDFSSQVVTKRPVSTKVLTGTWYLGIKPSEVAAKEKEKKGKTAASDKQAPLVRKPKN